MTHADLRWCESVARSLLRRMRAETAARVTVDDVCAALGLRVSPTAPRGCGGTASFGVLRLPAKGRPESVARAGHHEVGHVATMLWDGELDPHPEEAMSWVGLFTEIPWQAAVEAARSTGFEPAALRARFPGLYLSDVLLRCALATGGVAVLVRARSEAQWVANDVTHEEALGLELRVHAIADSARQRGTFVEANGWAAAPVHEPGRHGVLVIRR